LFGVNNFDSWSVRHCIIILYFAAAFDGGGGDEDDVL
jgi:hypothetical protein